MIPTQRSVIARLRYMSLDGGWVAVCLRRATRIIVFPKNAVIGEKVLMTERKTSSPCTSPVNSTEQWSSAIVCRFSPPVKFFHFSLCDSSIMSNTNYICRLYFHFIKRKSYWQSCCCRAIGNEANSTIVLFLENELKLSWTVIQSLLTDSWSIHL